MQKIQALSSVKQVADWLLDVLPVPYGYRYPGGVYGSCTRGSIEYIWPIRQ